MILSSKKSVPASMLGKYSLLAGVVVALSLTACGGGGGGDGNTGITEFSNFQAAKVVIGQPDFESGDANQGDTTKANTLSSPQGNVAVYAGILYVTDTANNRILGFNSIPTVNNQEANFAFGQDSMDGANSELFDGPASVSAGAGKFVVSSVRTNNVFIWNTVPTANGKPVPAATLGNIDGTFGCSASALHSPFHAMVANDKLIVADAQNNRVLIWDSIPDGTVPAPTPWALGQPDLTSCGSNGVGGTTTTVGFSAPMGVWSDGVRLAVADDGNKRVLIWNSFPTSDDQAPDVELTSASVDGSELRALNVYFSGTHFFVNDYVNNRVLVWKGFPTATDQPADFVLGQADFSNVAANDDNQDGVEDGPTAHTLSNPRGVYVDGKRLFVTDYENNRVLIFEAP